MRRLCLQYRLRPDVGDSSNGVTRKLAKPAFEEVTAKTSAACAPQEAQRYPVISVATSRPLRSTAHSHQRVAPEELAAITSPPTAPAVVLLDGDRSQKRN